MQVGDGPKNENERRTHQLWELHGLSRTEIGHRGLAHWLPVEKGAYTHSRLSDSKLHCNQWTEEPRLGAKTRVVPPPTHGVTRTLTEDRARTSQPGRRWVMEEAPVGQESEEGSCHGRGTPCVDRKGRNVATRPEGLSNTVTAEVEH